GPRVWLQQETPMNAQKKYRGRLLLSALLTAALLAGGLLAVYWPQPSSAGATADTAGELAGKVQVAGSPVDGATVTLYAAGEGKPTQLAQGKTRDDGAFQLEVAADQLKDAAGKVLYVVARGGTPKADGAKGPSDALALLSVLGTKLPKA